MKIFVSLNYTIEVCQKLPFGEQNYSKTQIEAGTF